jgi:hypothetical protein
MHSLAVLAPSRATPGDCAALGALLGRRRRLGWARLHQPQLLQAVHHPLGQVAPQVCRLPQQALPLRRHDRRLLRCRCRLASLLGFLRLLHSNMQKHQHSTHMHRPGLDS